MSSTEIVKAASDPVFYSRVAFLALKVAQAVSTEAENYPNHANRAAYANRVFQGADHAVLLAQHVAAAHSGISQALMTGGNDAVLDGDIENALTSIWDARATAFAPAPPPALIPIIP